jgi:flavin reductase (DIM6/NTAB) family NADH-FMN oxidoreductase RutF
MLALPTQAQAALTSALGGVSGRAVDKEAKLGLRYLDADPAAAKSPPRVAGCAGWLQCRVIREPHIEQTYDLFLGEVLAAWADPRVFSDGRWHFEGHDDLRTLHHVAGGAYFTPGDKVQG